MALGVIKEWSCIEHGSFERSHPICPAMGCNSKHVTREFLTPITIGSRMVRQHNQGLKQLSDMYKIGDFRTARAGEAAYGGDAARELGTEVLWGNDVQKLGHSFAELTAAAQKPLIVRKRDGSGELRLDRNNAMREAATEARITARKLPQAEVVAVRADKGADKAKAIAT